MENITYCFYCDCEIPESDPQFTFHFFIDEHNAIPLSTVSKHSFPLAYVQIAHEKDGNGSSYANEPYIVDLCSRNCFLLMEGYNEQDNGSNKKVGSN